jgi:hypothetical protein
MAILIISIELLNLQRENNMNNLSKLSKISYVVDILQQAREKLLEATNIINTDKRDELLETITSAIDEVYALLDMEAK